MAQSVDLDAAAGGQPRRLLIGVFSSLEDAQRRQAIRETWVAEARHSAPGIVVRFVLGAGETEQQRAAIASENSTARDLLVMPCAENQHRGKTLLWFAFVRRYFSDSFGWVAKMDQDVYVWPSELQAHLQGFSSEEFYGGVKVDVQRYRGQSEPFSFMNGGFVLLSQDLVAEIAKLVHNVTPTKEGFLDETPAFQGSEDVTLGLLLKWRQHQGRLRMNGGDFPWNITSDTWKTTTPGNERSCPWRHARDLKFITGFRRQWEQRHQIGCRCNCPDSFSEEEAKLFEDEMHRKRAEVERRLEQERAERKSEM